MGSADGSPAKKREGRGEAPYRQALLTSGREGGMASCRDGCMFNCATKKRLYSTMLLLAVFAAMLSVLGLGIALHKLREGRALGLLLQDRQRQLLTLHMILSKERSQSKDMRIKIEELRAKVVALRTEKMRLKIRLGEAEDLATHLKSELASLKGVGEASTKAANLQVATLKSLLNQQREEMERLSQPSNRPSSAEISNMNKTNESSTGEGEVAAKRSEDDAQTSAGGTVTQAENSRHGQGSEREKWVRLETVTDDGVDSADNGGGKSVEEEGSGKGEVSEVGKHGKGSQVPDQKPVKAGDEDRTNSTGQPLLKGSSTTAHGEVIAFLKDEDRSSNTTENSTVTASERLLNGTSSSTTADGEVIELLKDEDRSSNTTENSSTVTASELLLNGTSSSTAEGELAVIRDEEIRSSNTIKVGITASEEVIKLEQKDRINGAGEVIKQITDGHTQTSITGRGPCQRRTKGREGRAAARIWEQNVEASKGSPMGSSHQDQGENPADSQVFDRNNPAERRSGEVVQSKLPEERTASAGAEAEAQQTQANTGCLDSETRGSNIGSYPDTDGSEVKSDIDNKVSFDCAQQETISSSNASNMLGGARQEDGEPETRDQEDIVRSTVEATENLAAPMSSIQIM